jgi:predicted ArsR family transcriptional regulator
VVGGRSRNRVAAPKPTSSTRRPAIKADDLEAGILALSDPFSVKDVAERVGGSTVTIKTAIDRLEAQGKVLAAGERAGNRGRASRVWTVAVEPL